MRSGALVVALLEVGFTVRAADQRSVTARRAEPRILLNATAAADGGWKVRAFPCSTGLPRVDAYLRTPYDVISMLSSAYDIPTERTT